jgi:DNA-binding transcriptional LysR family regulator
MLNIYIEDKWALRHLRYFVTVADLGSVSRAAERRFIAQPPLSMQINDLEEELGVRLLVRHPRGVRLTPAGKAFLDEARYILDRSERAKRIARSSHRAAEGMLRIGYVQSGRKILPRLVRRLHAARPGGEFDVREMITTRATDSAGARRHRRRNRSSSAAGKQGRTAGGTQ